MKRQRAHSGVTQIKKPKCGRPCLRKRFAATFPQPAFQLGDWSYRGRSATVTLIVCEQDIVAQIHGRASRNGFDANVISPRSATMILPNADPVFAYRVSYDIGFPFHTRLLLRVVRGIVQNGARQPEWSMVPCPLRVRTLNTADN